MATKTTKITIETESLLVVHQGKTIVTRCPACCTEVKLITLEGNSLGAEIPSPLLREWQAAGKLHLWKSDSCGELVCVQSLLQCIEAQQGRRLSGPDSLSQKVEERG